jgi:hypothetical protein
MPNGDSPAERSAPMPRLLLLAPSVALLIALLLAGPALSALRIGTNGNETLVGTSANDQITGMGGGDRLKGLAGNDRYFFANFFVTDEAGQALFDTLIETATGGSDTVNFQGVSRSHVEVRLVREWAQVDLLWNRATAPGGGEVRFYYSSARGVVQSFVENAIGGEGGDLINPDIINGGGGKNVLQPGGGTGDLLADYGGWKDDTGRLPEIPASNDVYKGFANPDDFGFARIADWGGTNDVLDLRPFSIDDVYIGPIDLDSTPATLESLQIVAARDSQIVVQGQFGDYAGQLALSNFQGRIETIVFADETIIDMSSLRQVAAASTGATSGKRATLAAAADRLAIEARRLIDPKDPTGSGRSARDLDRIAGVEATGSEQQHKDDKHNKHQKHHKRR